MIFWGTDATVLAVKWALSQGGEPQSVRAITVSAVCMWEKPSSQVRQ